MAVIIDVLTALVIIVCGAIGFSRGFVKYAIKMLGTLVCIMTALIVSSLTAQPVYEKFIQPKIESTIEQRLEGFDIVSEVENGLNGLGYDVEIPQEQLKEALSDSGNISTAIAQVASENGADSQTCENLQSDLEVFFGKDLTGELCKKIGITDGDEVAESLNLTGGEVYDLIRAFSSEQGISSASEYIVGNLMEYFMITVTRYVLFVIILIVAESVLAIIFAIAGVFDHIPAVNGVNRFFGLVLGLAKGVLYILLASLIISQIRSCAEAGSISVNFSFIDSSSVFGCFYRFIDKLFNR